MMSPQIAEREDRKRISLLAYAMERSDHPRGSWAAAYDRAELGPRDDCICLFREENRWQVAYTERGTWREMGTFADCYEAANFFWASFHCPSSPYDHREAWERQTGLSFSMME